MIPKSTRTVLTAATFLTLATLSGCRPEAIFFNVTNGSGGTLHNIKLTNCKSVSPSFLDADFNIDSLANSTLNAIYGHFDGPGDLTISYTTEDGHTYTSTGPHVTGDEKGTINITIDGSSASFSTQFDQPQP